MKKLFLLLSLFATKEAFSQDSLAIFNTSRNNITMGGLRILTIWGGSNIGAGIAAWACPKNNAVKYYGQMNTFWGAINLGLGITGYHSAKRNSLKHPDKAGNLNAQQSIERTFLINGALDLAYIGAGIYLDNRGQKRDNSKLKGYGASVIEQGIFLLLFDGTMYTLQRTNGNKFRRFLQHNSVSFSGKQVAIMHTF